jgi:hypothetical protein
MSDLSEALDAAQGSPQAGRFVEELIIGLERAADGESDPNIKARLRGAAATLETVGRHVATETAAAIIVRAMDL